VDAPAERPQAPRPPTEALLEAAELLDKDPDTARGRPSSIDEQVVRALDDRQAGALDALAELRTDLARDVLRRVASTASGELRLRAAAKLVARNDIVGLEPVATALLHPEGLSRNMLLDLAGSLEGLKNPQAVPTLTKLVKANNPDINRPAAAALRQSGSSAALEPLSSLLDSPDRLTRYYAVVGMGEITHEDKWTPAFDEFQEHEQRYLSHWGSWARANFY
jgi:HEAT repeat protein